MGHIMHKVQRSLHSGWRVRAGSGPAPEPIAAAAAVPAVVPGVVHLDLHARPGLIPDPYLDDNESALAWIGLVDWTYETTFTLTAAELAAADRHELVFDGLDTVATVSLNDAVDRRGREPAPLATARRDRAAARRARTSSTSLSAARCGTRMRRASPSARDRARTRLPYDAIRKSACSFGWDWGIATVDERHLAAGAARIVVDRAARGGARAPPEPAATAASSAVRARRSGRSTRAAVTLELTSIRGGRHERGRDRRRERCRRRRARRARRRRALVARRLRRPSRSTTSRVALLPATRCSTRRPGGSASATLRWNTEPDAAGTPFQLRRQRPADLREGRQLDPRRRVPGARRPGTLRAPTASRRRPRTSTSSGSGAAASTSPTTSTSSATSSAC